MISINLNIPHETNDEKITPSRVVKSLGALFDEYLTFEKQVDMIVKTCNIYLRNLSVIGSKLNYDLGFKDSRIQGFKDSNKLITFIEFTIVVILK